MGGKLLARNRTAALGRTSDLPKATLVGALSAQGRRRRKGDWVLTLAEKDVAQDHRLVVLFVARCVDERDLSAPRERAQVLQQFRVLAKLGRISAPELSPTLGVVTEPFPQFVARREILHPQIEGRRLFP